MGFFSSKSLAILLATGLLWDFRGAIGASKPTAEESEPALKAGQTTQLTSGGTYHLNYHVAIPEAWSPSESRALLILFSPRGDGARILKTVAPAANRYGWIAVGVDKLKNGAMNTRTMWRMEDDVLDAIFESVPHDSDRVYLGGLSGGAMRAYSVTVRRSEPFAGVVAMGGWLGGTPYAQRDYPHGMAVAMISGNKDVGALQWSKHDATVFTRRGGRVQMFVFPGGHEMPPTKIVRQAVKWLEQDWRDYR